MRSQLAIRFLRRTKVAEQLDHPPGHWRRHGRAAGDGFLQAFQQPGRRCALEQVAAGAGAQRLEDALVVLVYREHERGHSRIALF